MNRPEARLIATFVVMGLALSGTFTALLLEGAGDRAAPPPRKPLPATATAAPSPTYIGSMPELWGMELDAANGQLAALGITARVQRTNPDGGPETGEWVVTARAPAPGALLMITMPVFLIVEPRD
ncbi:PASTA domain-containing protein [Actinomadura sp. ATCC 39365]